MLKCVLLKLNKIKFKAKKIRKRSIIRCRLLMTFLRQIRMLPTVLHYGNSRS